MKRPIAASLVVAASLLAGAVSAQPAGGGGVREACAADLQKVCPDAMPGPGGGMRECVRAHFASLSDACKAAIQKMRAQRQQQQGGAPQGGQ